MLASCSTGQQAHSTKKGSQSYHRNRSWKPSPLCNPLSSLGLSQTVTVQVMPCEPGGQRDMSHVTLMTSVFEPDIIDRRWVQPSLGQARTRILSSTDPPA